MENWDILLCRIETSLDIWQGSCYIISGIIDDTSKRVEVKTVVHTILENNYVFL
jgi:hypothetical protein